MKTYGPKINPAQKEKLLAALKARPYLKPLAQKLIAIGGDVPCIWNEDFSLTQNFVAVLLGLARLSNGSYARPRQMEQNRCHHNAIKLAAKYPHKYQRETGLALSDDGIWRVHSWAFDMAKNEIVETTVPQRKYFGVTLAITAGDKEEIKAA